MSLKKGAANLHLGGEEFGSFFLNKLAFSYLFQQITSSLTQAPLHNQIHLYDGSLRKNKSGSTGLDEVQCKLKSCFLLRYFAFNSTELLHVFTL